MRKVSYKLDYYIIGNLNSENSNKNTKHLDITLVAPTRVAVKQGKSEINHEKGIDSMKKTNNQIGGNVVKITKESTSTKTKPKGVSVP